MDLDPIKVELECLECHFFNIASLRQIRLNDVVICRGCKSNLQLVDYMGTVAKARRDFRREIERLQEAFNKISTIKLSL